jgi:hypothetical protein
MVSQVARIKSDAKKRVIGGGTRKFRRWEDAVPVLGQGEGKEGERRREKVERGGQRDYKTTDNGLLTGLKSGGDAASTYGDWGSEGKVERRK